eukprot:GEMP01033532.1.p1 GENE.GEMP01033532.1~~GEMP01033532.1.p1  ORF type:complete len:522 (+),score=85.85 GEMP01033532.1:199-1764(+)
MDLPRQALRSIRHVATFPLQIPGVVVGFLQRATVEKVKPAATWVKRQLFNYPCIIRCEDVRPTLSRQILLPLDVIARVLQFLKLPDAGKHACVVCKTWEMAFSLSWETRSEDWFPGKRTEIIRRTSGTWQKLALARSFTKVKWHEVVVSELAPREGTPHSFVAHDCIWVYGGWAIPWGMTGEVACASLEGLRDGTWQLDFETASPVTDDSAPPPVSYGSSFTPLEYKGEWADGIPHRYIVAGGFLRGGYQNETHEWAILTIVGPRRYRWTRPAATCPLGEDQQPANWESPDPRFSFPIARGNAAACYIPPHLSCAEFPRGCVMLHGGNQHSQPSGDFDILDLATWTWHNNCRFADEVKARNSHTLMLHQNQLHIIGGADGRDVPRSGMEVMQACVVDPQKIDIVTATPLADIYFIYAPRAHTTVSIDDYAMISFGGGVAGTTSVVNLTRKAPVEMSGQHRPFPRSFHGCCNLYSAGLPMVFIFGGWHPRVGVLHDAWVMRTPGCVDFPYARIASNMPYLAG